MKLASLAALVAALAMLLSAVSGQATMASATATATAWGDRSSTSTFTSSAVIDATEVPGVSGVASSAATLDNSGAAAALVDQIRQEAAELAERISRDGGPAGGIDLDTSFRLPSLLDQQQQTPSSSSSVRGAPVAAAPTTLPTTTTSGGGGADSNDPLAYHNRFRAAHGAAPLTWSASIAAGAAQYAQRCIFEHDHGSGYGENLAIGYSSWAAAQDAWYNEVSIYNFSDPGYSPATGHFTQMVWKATTELGCGAADCGPSRGVMYVCRYNPPGNVIGTFNEQVSPAGAA